MPAEDLQALGRVGPPDLDVAIPAAGARRLAPRGEGQGGDLAPVAGDAAQQAAGGGVPQRDRPAPRADSRRPPPGANASAEIMLPRSESVRIGPPASSQTRSERSSLPEASHRPPGSKARTRTQSSCPSRGRMRPPSTSPSQIVLSCMLPMARVRPSVAIATQVAIPLGHSKAASSRPEAASQTRTPCPGRPRPRAPSGVIATPTTGASTRRGSGGAARVAPSQTSTAPSLRPRASVRPSGATAAHDSPAGRNGAGRTPRATFSRYDHSKPRRSSGPGWRRRSSRCPRTRATSPTSQGAPACTISAT